MTDPEKKKRGEAGKTLRIPQEPCVVDHFLIARGRVYW